MKVGERTRRAREMQAGTGREYNVIGGGPLPSWKKFLSVSSNKESSLISYVNVEQFFQEALKMVPK